MKTDSVKTIKLSKAYVPDMTSVENEESIVQSVLCDIFTRFPTEHNTNALHEAQEALKGYRYVNNKYCIPEGRYVRYLNTNDGYKVVLKTGGFCTSDNGYSIRLKAMLNSEYVTFTLRKWKRPIFMKINRDDIIRCYVNNEMD